MSVCCRNNEESLRKITRLWKDFESFHRVFQIEVMQCVARKPDLKNMYEDGPLEEIKIQERKYKLGFQSEANSIMERAAPKFDLFKELWK